MKLTIIRKWKYDYGVNTLIKNKNGKYFILSSMRMKDGYITYSVYDSNEDSQWLSLYWEDRWEGYYELLKQIDEL